MESNEKLRYSDEELEEFRVLINEKIDKATKEYKAMQMQLNGDNTRDDNDTTSPFNDLFDESMSNMQKSELRRLMERQVQFIEKLEGALKRIDNKTYGICKTTGKLIPKERLLRVPHATECIEAKEKRKP